MNSDGGTDAYEAHTLSEMLHAGDAARTALHSAYCSAGVAARSQPRHRSILLTLVGITTRVFASLCSRSAASAFRVFFHGSQGLFLGGSGRLGLLGGY